MTWSDSNKKWDGFRLTGYSLAFEKVRALSLTERRYADGNAQETSRRQSVRFSAVISTDVFK